jgi:hypothetical protein
MASVDRVVLTWNTFDPATQFQAEAPELFTWLLIAGTLAWPGRPKAIQEHVSPDHQYTWK